MFARRSPRNRCFRLPWHTAWNLVHGRGLAQAALFTVLLADPRGAPAARAESESAHVVFDLIANRALAHVEQAGGLVIHAGAPGMARYVHFGRPTPTWRLRASVDGKRVALPTTSARLQVPLLASQAQAAAVWLSLKSPARSSLKITVGSGPSAKASAAVPLNPGWQLVSVPLPPDSLRAGENPLTLTFAQAGSFPVAGGTAPGGFKAGAAVEWIQVGGTAPAQGTSPAAIAEGSKLLVPGNGALYYYAFLPKGASLRLRGDGGGCGLKVTVEGPQPNKRGAPFDAALDGSPLPLGPAGGALGEVRRLGLHASGSCGHLSLTEAQLLMPGTPPVVRRDQRPRNVVFWLSDDTRADKYRLWNKGSRVETPILDEFSKQATRFSVTYAQGNESRVSHASLFTGLYPSQHRFISDKAVLSADFDIIPEVMKRAGLYTIGHIANGYISKRWGFGDGWDLMKNHIHEGGGLRGSDLVAAARDFFNKGAGRDKNKPFFMYLGTIDAHVSWRAYEPWISRYDPKPYTGPFVKGCMDPQLDKIVAGQLTVTARDRERVIALYDSDISYNDQQFGAMLDLLKKAGRDGETMIVFTSDHGEEFWDHGRIGHGQSLRQELIHIPMWIYYPPLFPAGKTVEEGTELVDVLPTLADAFGVPIPKNVQGESLIPLAQGLGQGYPRPAVASQYELAHTMRLGRYKLWVGGSGQVKLYDASTDPGEQSELSAERPLELRFVSDAMGLWMAYQDRWKKARWGVASNLRPEFAADLESEKEPARLASRCSDGVRAAAVPRKPVRPGPRAQSRPPWRCQ
jgi:arylsulfatase A-like enzyme